MVTYEPHSCQCVVELDAAGKFVSVIDRCKLHKSVNDKEFWDELKSHAAQFSPNSQTSSKSDVASETWQEVYGDGSSPAWRERVTKALLAADAERERISSLEGEGDKGR